MSEQTKLFLLNNQNLFSNNYLDHRLPNTALWKEQEEKVSYVFDVIKKTYDETKSLKLGPGEEAGLEDKFIRPVLHLLGYEWDVQPTTKRGLKKKRPDYALFKDKASLTDARKERDNLVRFFKHPVTILEAKYWGRRLNDSDPKDTLDKRDPTAQTVKYLDDVYHASESRIQWAILTNGKAWRLFYYRAASRAGNYFEVDLEEMILRNDPEKFLYFYLFFSKDAFIPDPATGKTWLEQHLRETEEYATRVSDKLKSLIFDQIFEGLASGFIGYRSREMGIAKETDESLKEIFNGCLTLLYRMLFLLYAESRGLLPVNDPNRYYKKSLKKIKEDVRDELSKSGVEGMSHNAFDYWTRLESLFRIIDKGDRALNIPIYNGGLFETVPDSFLTTHKISDPCIAIAIEQLTVDPEAEHAPGTPPFFDYSSLNVRHLGDIYEGLLEFHVRITEEDIVEIKEKGKSRWKKESEVKTQPKIGRKKSRGEVYIENSKHERKATGSYYTPHYIVEYIVNNTVGLVLRERLDKAKAVLSSLDSLYEKQRKRLKKPVDWKHWEHPGEAKGKHADNIVSKEHEVFELLFDIKVLDPSMGSGHFLVHTVDFISDKIITFLAEYPDNPVVRKIDELRAAILSNIREQEVTIDETKLTEVNLIKRMVMKRCIYGVDLNEMAVELAKLSLWLDSFTLGAPLSFLDHHLKCGNSLIGVFDISDVIIPGSEMYGQVQRALSYMLQVAELTDATVAEARTSYELFKKGREAIKPILRRFDASTARHFIDTGWNPRIEQLAYTLNYEGETYAEVIETCKKAIKIAGEKRFFHWKVEFPEVFYADKGEKENPEGFDCTIGNPPYGLLSKDGYFKQNYSFVNPNWDIYIAFIERGIAVARRKGFISYIAPVSWETGAMFERLREFFINRTSIKQIVNLPFDVFKDAYIDTCIFVAEKSENASNKALVYEFPNKAKVDKLDTIDYREIEQARWLGNKNQIILDSHALYMLPKLFQTCLKLGDITVSVRGVLASPDFISDRPTMAHDPFFDGEMIRYEISAPDKFIRYSDELPEKPANIDFFKEGRVLVRRLISRQDRLMATYAADFFINKKDIYIVKATVENYLPYYLLALINSKLLSFLYLSQDTISKKDDFRQTTLDGVRSLPIPPISFTTPDKVAILSKLEEERLIAKDRSHYSITNLGAILFAKNLSDFGKLSRKAPRVIIYKGKDKLHTIKEQVGSKGYALGFEGMITFINDKLPTNEEIGKVFRKEVKMYPELAIRELVANALIHQDFSETGTGPMVELFDGRIEISNPGKPLISTLRFIDHNPQSRNEKLAYFMRRINICEERGSGIDKVVNMAEIYQLPAPNFIEGDNFLRVVLYAYKTLRQMDKEDKIRACYQHCCLKYVSAQYMSNQTLRERFKIDEKNYAIVSRIIAETIEAGLIKYYDVTSKSKKYAKYVPYWT